MYYNGGTQSVEAHIIQHHIVQPGPGDSRYGSSYNFGPTDIFNNIVKFHNSNTLRFGTLVGSGGTTYILEFTYPGFQILGVQLKGIGYSKTGNVVRTNRLLVQDDCKTVITSYPVEP